MVRRKWDVSGDVGEWEVEFGIRYSVFSIRYGFRDSFWTGGLSKVPNFFKAGRLKS